METGGAVAVDGVAPARAFGAAWRNDKGDVVATTSAKTMCLWPRLPWRIRFFRDGWEGVIPCRECPGCLELERTRLAERLHEKYGSRLQQGADTSRSTRERRGAQGGTAPDSLFVVRIWAPIELHAQFSPRLPRPPSPHPHPAHFC